MSPLSPDDDPMIGAFLRFLADDMATHPERLVPISASRIALAVQLAANVTVSDDEVLDDDPSVDDFDSQP